MGPGPSRQRRGLRDGKEIVPVNAESQRNCVTRRIALICYTIATIVLHTYL